MPHLCFYYFLNLFRFFPLVFPPVFLEYCLIVLIRIIFVSYFSLLVLFRRVHLMRSIFVLYFSSVLSTLGSSSSTVPSLLSFISNRGVTTTLGSETLGLAALGLECPAALGFLTLILAALGALEIGSIPRP